MQTLHETYAHWYKQVDGSIIEAIDKNNGKIPNPSNKYGELKALKELFDMEILTEDQFVLKKRQMLGI